MVETNPSQVGTRMPSIVTFLIFLRSFSTGIRVVFTATLCPAYVPHLTSPNPPKASISSRISSPPVILMRSGSSWQRSASLLNVMRKTPFSAGLRSHSAMP